MVELEDWKQAGRIAAQALQYGRGLIRKGAKLVEVCDLTDAKIRELGGEPAFPSQVSSDHIAAHFCPLADDVTLFDKQVASLDVGVHVNGAIGDTACTIDLSGNNANLVKASEEALAAALKIVAPGVTLGQLGTAIQEAIKNRGFTPVRNLSGHGLEENNLHAAPTIPNVAVDDDTPLEIGQVVAIEPFASTGSGIVEEAGEPTIFSIANPKPVRSPYAREVLSVVQEYGPYPFTTRWVAQKIGIGKTRFGLRELMQAGVLQTHPPLLDTQRGLCSQAEHSIYIDEKPIILTKL